MASNYALVNNYNNQLAKGIIEEFSGVDIQTGTSQDKINTNKYYEQSSKRLLISGIYAHHPRYHKKLIKQLPNNFS